MLWRIALLMLLAVTVGTLHFAPQLTAASAAMLPFLSDLGSILWPALAAAACFRAARRVGEAERKAWRWFGAGCLCWLGGAWVASIVGAGDPSFPGAADAGYLLACILFIPGMFHYGSDRHSLGRIQLCNFGMVLVGTALTVFVLMIPLLQDSRQTLLGTVVAFAYPATWFGTLAFGAICFLLYARPEKRPVFALLLLAITAQALADLRHALALLTAGEEAGFLFEGLRSVCFALILWAAVEEVWKSGFRTTASQNRGEQKRLAEAFLPGAAAVAILTGFCLSAYLLGSDAHLLALPVALVFAAFLGLREYWSLKVERDLAAQAKRTSGELAASRAQISAVLESTTDSVLLLDQDLNILYRNERARKLIGRQRDLTVGSNLWEAFPEEIGSRIDRQYRYALARQVPVELEEYLPSLGLWLAIHAYPTPDGLSVFFRDVTERRRIEAQLVHLAHHDPLTKLANRALFHRELEQALSQRVPSVALLCLDIDQFKEVNDTLGHPAGDELLSLIAQRLSECVRSSDTVARLGGDEFAVVAVPVHAAEEAEALAERIIARLSEPFELQNRTVCVGCSIGIALAEEGGIEADELFKLADIALYRAKAEGRGTHRVFRQEMEEQLLDRQALKSDLAAALENSEFELNYQPIMNLADNRVHRFEALIRWRHPVKGMVSPADFIPVAEETGLILQIGSWALRQACAEASEWPSEISVAINLSPCQFKSSALPLQVAQALGVSGLDPRRLVLEITESVLLHDSEANRKVIQKLRDLGVKVALDDFGTGYSSLSYLRSFPLDSIKIDRSFVQGLETCPQAQAIVSAVIDLGHSLDVSITAEGVETRQQLDRLRQHGCDELQGFFFSKAVAARDVMVTASQLNEAARWWSARLSRAG